MNRSFVRISTGVILVAVLVAGAWLGSTPASAQPGAQATMMATMGAGGDMMSGPRACPMGLAEQVGKTMMTGANGMMATMAASGAMMGTEPAMMGTMEAPMMGTAPAMMGTEGAMMGAMGAPVCLVAKLFGTEEVPAGDPDGEGYAAVSIDPVANTIFFEVWVGNITLPAKAMHIHMAYKGKAGDVVVPADSAPDASGLVMTAGKADAALIQKILANPAGFYVNVHTSDFPTGAVRGQLEEYKPDMMGNGMDNGMGGGMSATMMATTAP